MTTPIWAPFSLYSRMLPPPEDVTVNIEAIFSTSMREKANGSDFVADSGRQAS